MRFSVPHAVRGIYPDTLWDLPSSDVCLTFDDGPHPVATPKVLKILRDRGIKASFFLVGRQAARNPDLVHQIIAEGHLVGNHTYDHKMLLLRSHSYIRHQIERTDDALKSAGADHSRHFRPPFGFVRPGVPSFVRKLGFHFVMWSVDSGDFRPASSRNIARHVLQHLHSGAIVLFHDNESTQNRIDGILNHLFDDAGMNGLHFATLPS